MRVGLLAVTVWVLLASIGNTALADDVCGNAGVICYVDKNSQSCCTGSGCAGTETAPFCTIKEGLATVVDEGTVRVNDGEYNEDKITFPVKSVTLESINGAESTSIIEDAEDAFTKLEIYDLGEKEATIEGFTFAGGTGRAIVIDDSKVTIRHCAFSANGRTVGVPFYGGAIIISSGSSVNVSIEDSLFCQNQAFQGGAIEVNTTHADDSVAVSGCTFEHNFAEGPGGAIDVPVGAKGTLIVAESLFRANRAVYYGGAISGKTYYRYNFASSSESTDVCDNDPDHTMTIQNSIFVANTTLGSGENGGGGAVAAGPDQFIDVHNCTFFGNRAMASGGGVQFWGACAKVYNSILWDNTAPGGDEIEVRYGGDLTLKYSDVEGGISGIILTGDVTTNIDDDGELDAQMFIDADNIADDPLFCDVASYDFQVSSDSPALEAGDNDLALGDTDYAGFPRIADYDYDQVAIVDMGAYERETETTCMEGGGLELQCPCDDGTFDVGAEDPPDGTIDARRPHPSGDSSFDKREGIGSPNSYTDGPEPITITFDQVPPTGNDIGCWSVCETDIEEVEYPTESLEANRVKSIVRVADGVYEILLERPISAGQWTTITYEGSGDQVTYASLPGDVGGNETTTASDILDFVDCCLDDPITCWSGGEALYRCDVNHSGAIEAPVGYPPIAPDVAEVSGLLTGSGTWIQWNNVSLPETNSCEETEAMAGGTSWNSLSPESFPGRFVTFVIGFVPTARLGSGAFVELATTMVGLAAAEMSGSERLSLAAMLEAAEPYCESEDGAAIIPELVDILTK